MAKHEHPVVILLHNQINTLRLKSELTDSALANLRDAAGDYELGVLEGESMAYSMMLTELTDELTNVLFSGQYE